MSKPKRQFYNSKNYEDQINPWNADDTPNINGFQYLSFTPYHHLNRHTIAFNPQSSHQSTQKKQGREGRRVNNFADNLRKYEMKKAEELQIKNETNFIQKNRKELIEELPHKIYEDRQASTTTSSIYDKSKLFHSNHIQHSGELVNWSVIMYYDNDKSKRKHNHKDIQSFLRFHSSKIEKSTKKQLQSSFDNHPDLVKMEHQAFQKMLKLKEGIRKRNLKSASSSRKNLQESQTVEDIQIPTPKKGIHNQQLLAKNNQRREVPMTSDLSRKLTSKLLENRPQTVRNKNMINSGRKEQKEQRRMIHSSHRGRSQSKVLNIEGNKLSS